MFDLLGFKESLQHDESKTFILKLDRKISYDEWITIMLEEDNSIVCSIRHILTYLFGESADDIEYTQNLLETKLLDSMTSVNLIAAIERKFNIEVGFEELSLSNFQSIEAIYNFIKEKLG